MQEPFYLNFLGGGEWACLRPLDPKVFGEAGWEIGIDREVVVDATYRPDLVNAVLARPPKPRKPVRLNRDGTPRKMPKPTDAQLARAAKLAEVEYRRDVPPVRLTRVRRQVWRCMVRLKPCEQRSLGQWLARQKRHVKREPWVHPRVPEFRFEHYPPETSREKMRVEMVWVHKLGEERCRFPVLYLLEQLEEMAKMG